MGFQLVIAEGSEAGREFAFDQSAVTIGRTPECDVILYDTGVSRKHARIIEVGGAFFVEDLGSSNGTLVNGARVERQLLHEGDAIALGPVLLSFRAVELAPEQELGATEGQGAHTRILSVAELQRSRNRGVALLPKGSTRAQMDELARKKTGTLPVLRPSRTHSSPKAPRAAPVEEGGGPGDTDEDGLARRPPSDSSDTDLAHAPKVAVRRSPRPHALSAAERARMRRQGLAGYVKLWWTEATPLIRALVITAGASVAVTAIGGLIYISLPAEKPKLVEPEVLTLEATPYSFGLGAGVTFEQPDQKTFEFEVKSPVQVMGVVHFQSKDIDHRDEVSVTVNGHELGALTPDPLDADEREYEMLVPAALITRTGVNTLTFDSVDNPPGRNPWRVWNVWLEIAVLPEKDELSLAIDAQEKLEKGDQKWTQRDIGAANRWEAYKQFREAWLALEALPVSVRPATHLVARRKMLEARVELDNMCRTLLREARALYNLKQYNEARLALDHVLDYFPSKHHPCQAKAEIDRDNYGL